MPLISYSDLPPKIPEGLLQAIESALNQAGFPAVASLTPDGLLVSNAENAMATVGGFDGSQAQLSFAKERRAEELAYLVTSKFSADYNYGGKAFQIDPDSVAKIGQMGSLAGLVAAGVSGATWPSDFHWIAADNAQISLDASGMVAFASAVAGYVSGIVLRNRQLKDAVAAAGTMGALQAIDFSQGWPAN